ncbi:hypothetical protein BB561_006867 [Smittium simulii]|uniref:Alpha-mannosidase n=1 Tax=Smittium simulii TaxID=133385 RepID=A0A2T9Y0R9_9FUNG|nr:hypothetical protein BB561_006867 [Smittium simulii]
MSANNSSSHTYLQKHQEITKERLRNFMKPSVWSSINLLSTLWSKETEDTKLIKIEVWSPSDLSKPNFKHATAQNFRPTRVGESFGPSWSTHWFKINVTIPENYNGDQVFFQFDPDCEGLVWTTDGRPVQGLTGGGGDNRRIEYFLTDCAKAGEKFSFYIETACNGLFGNGQMMIAPPDENRYYSLNKASIGVKRQEAWQLWYDVVVIVDMAHHIGSDNPRGINALYTANEIANVFDPSNPDITIPIARKIASSFLQNEPSPATHQITAVGNCHIDTAWLWTYDETKRKVARSFVSQLNLMDKFPEYIFAASQAQQFEWLEQNYSSLFQRVQKYSKRGQFVPVGGTWVEMDCNIPSGESLVRQFLLGQRYFIQKFNTHCKIFWLPDTFGYAAQLPQIVQQTGGKYFFTQKLSWNNINKFPNTTFHWVGLDGSSILTHMAPAETYTGNAQVNEIVGSVKKHRDLSSHNTSLYLYGLGDGGGGPQEPMIERIRRMSNVDGLPKIKHTDPTSFYEDLEKNSRSLPSWHGELYFELHRGTYTSQANTKKYNRKCEYLLRTAEMLSTFAYSSQMLITDYKYPYEELLRLWKLLCLNQFHDVIPGSSIEHVYKDSDKIYLDIIFSANRIIHEAMLRLTCSDFASYNHISHDTIQANPSLTISDFETSVPCFNDTFKSISINDIKTNSNLGNKSIIILNSCAWTRSSVVTVHGIDKLHPLVGQVMKARKSLSETGQSEIAIPYNICLCATDSVPGMSISFLNNKKKKEPIPSSAYYSKDKMYILENLLISAAFNNQGQLCSLIDRKTGREFVSKLSTGNIFNLYEDIPIFWDAWDVEIYHLEKYKSCKVTSVEIVENGPLLSSICIKAEVGDGSKLQQWVSLTATSSVLEFETEVDWKEAHKILKVEFNWEIKSESAFYETQYGYINRPTHKNTSWDMAKFEVCGHKFGDLSEYKAGVTLINDSKYGYSCSGNKMSLSLLRSPKSPDANCDMKLHTFRYGIYAHTTSFPDPEVIRKAHSFNIPLEVLSIDSNALISPDLMMFNGNSAFGIKNASNVILDTVKIAEPELQKLKLENNSQLHNTDSKAESSLLYGKNTLIYATENKRANKKLVLRMYEACGGHAIIHFSTLYKVKSIHRCDMLERIIEEYKESDLMGIYKIAIKPFEVITLILELA